ncbi:hypothetical protein, partial [Bosea sp. NPDC055594]
KGPAYPVDDFYTARARTSAGASLDGFLTAVHMVVTLNRVSAHLASDGALMPPGTCEALGLSPGSSYAAGVTEAYRERTRLSRQIIDRFAT